MVSYDVLRGITLGNKLKMFIFYLFIYLCIIYSFIHLFIYLFTYFSFIYLFMITLFKVGVQT